MSEVTPQPEGGPMALSKLLFPYLLRAQERLEKNDLSLAHYTTAENGLRIIQTKEIWLRNAAVMNDFLEVSHGCACLAECTRAGSTFRLLEALFPDERPEGVGDMVLRVTDPRAHAHTYLTSLSEHRPDDTLGRLSMWRAYGGDTAGVALILNPEFIASDRYQLGAFSSPVLYGGFERFLEEMETITAALGKNVDLVRSISPDDRHVILFNALRFAVLSCKHKGFEEEQEWRVIHSPRDFASAFIQPKITSIRGVPQIVYPIKLMDQPGLGMPIIEIPRLIRRIVIGPTSYPAQVREALVEALLAAGVDDAAQKVVASDIPLRQRH